VKYHEDPSWCELKIKLSETMIESFFRLLVIIVGRYTFGLIGSTVRKLVSRISTSVNDVDSVTEKRKSELDQVLDVQVFKDIILGAAIVIVVLIIALKISS